jgi:hypothetical protein
MMTLLAVILACQFPEPCLGQRAVASLGSKLKNKFRRQYKKSSSSSPSSKDYIIQQGKKTTKNQETFGDEDRRKRPLVIAVGATLGLVGLLYLFITTILLDKFSFLLKPEKKKSSSSQKDGELIWYLLMVVTHYIFL